MEGDAKDPPSGEGTQLTEKQVLCICSRALKKLQLACHLDRLSDSTDIYATISIQVYGDYQIVRPIGKGKFAIVYRAQRISDGEIGIANLHLLF